MTPPPAISRKCAPHSEHDTEPHADDHADRDDTPVWTPEAIRRLGMTTDLDTAAAILGIGRTLAHDLARRGESPVRILRLGRRVLIPTDDLLTYLSAPAGIPARTTGSDGR